MGGIVTDYHAPVLGKRFSDLVDSEQFCSLWEQIKKVLPYFDVIHFEKQPEHIYGQYNPFLYLDCWPFHEKSYVATLDGSWDNFNKSKTRKNIYADSCRQRRRLAEIGDLQFKVVGEYKEIEALTSKMIEQKTRRYQETGVRNLFEDDKYRRFYLDTAKELAKTDIVHVSGLFLDDTIIAAHWGLIFRDRFYYLMPSFEGGPWAKYSPGRLLQEHLIKWCFDSGIKIFDFTVGDDSYKYNWADKEMKLYEYYEPVSLKGKQYILFTNIRQNLKKYSNLLNGLRKVKNTLKK
jgi:CelD/BcsL family acetyltransferase involved in cellulose biosynthesis